MSAPNPLIRDRDVEFLLYEVHHIERMCELPAFADHERETFELFLASAARLAREQLYPLFREMDEQPPELIDGRVHEHPKMGELYASMVELGILTAGRPESVGGAQLPQSITTIAYMYLMAGNAGASGYPLLTAGSGHLIESFASDELKAMFMRRMYDGEWSGTMSLTEPQAGSGLGDLTTSATPIEGREGVYKIRGSKIFISAGDHQFLDNIVHLTLARVVGDPAGTRGISLFAVPRMRPTADGGLEFNDVHTSQLVHKIGWKGLPSLGLSYGENDDCHGWLVGEPCKGLRYMFQMMNEARLLVGANGTATASAAYHESLAYARVRTQGRRLDQGGARGGDTGPIPIIEHPDVRRMLLRQKAIVEGSMSLLITTARYADLAAHGSDPAERARAQLLYDILTPVTKSFPAERGFESTSLALQIHGGYGYSSEYLPELWLREQRLNSIHEGTTGIQSLDLLGRKVVAEGGKALMTLDEELRVDIEDARRCGVDEELCDTVKIELGRVAGLTQVLGARALGGDVIGMLAHSVDYLNLFSNLVISWQWLRMAAAACRGLGGEVDDEGAAYYRAKIEAARYWIRTDLADNARLAVLCESGEDSYLKVPDSGW
ncbi:putative acyl-CoA dehydrogenase AidB [Enhygromyxa salina]|uniref:Putative acyl-CoA dehydrogenase AidB n=1 Tax=Enhygromyxa salina TaxID=215803 RepID=A0A2S9XJP1_9BACT|nr:acyl-CoA dehydrogenase [Enhygromyxa salina]PRP93096.1 putative acyl-CoA dehydrogenase AidB [Enhygromyxa salina]